MRALKGFFSNVGIVVAARAVGFSGVYALSGDEPLAGPTVAMFSGECDTKGNIDIGPGKRIYHMLGQRYYSATIIRPEHGERWFCSEAEARAAGWRRSRV